MEAGEITEQAPARGAVPRADRALQPLPVGADGRARDLPYACAVLPEARGVGGTGHDPYEDNAALVTQSDVVVLSVRTERFADLNVHESGKLVISVMAGGLPDPAGQGADRPCRGPRAAAQRRGPGRMQHR